MAMVGKLNASVLARREQAHRAAWVTPSLSMSFWIMATPSAEQRKSCSRTMFILPDLVATLDRAATSTRLSISQPLQM
jgi:hypothetical protein